MLWAGIIMSALPVLMLLFSCSGKLLRTEQVVKGIGEFGYAENVLIPLGIVEFLCAVMYVVPRTSVLGAILITGYLGGAVATHVRVADPAFIMPALLGVLAWGGLYLRDPRVRALIPLRKPL